MFRSRDVSGPGWLDKPKRIESGVRSSWLRGEKRPGLAWLGAIGLCWGRRMRNSKKFFKVLCKFQERVVICMGVFVPRVDHRVWDSYFWCTGWKNQWGLGGGQFFHKLSKFRAPVDRVQPIIHHIQDLYSCFGAGRTTSVMLVMNKPRSGLKVVSPWWFGKR